MGSWYQTQFLSHHGAASTMVVAAAAMGPRRHTRFIARKRQSQSTATTSTSGSNRKSAVYFARAPAVTTPQRIHELQSLRARACSHARTIGAAHIAAM